MGRIVALIVLLIAMVGLALRIEAVARPDTGRTGRHVAGEHSD